MTILSPFPVQEVLPQLAKTLADSRQCLLVAPPGAGKTTQVPLALYSSDWLAGRNILMLEPRRLAARSAAAFMARQLGEPVGQTVGYTVRLDRKVSRQTRIEVVTEGILTRRLQNDPELGDVGLIIFDEFHERNIHSDLGLALVRDIQQGLRDDLRVLVMSATLDVRRLREFFGDVPEVVSEGRMHDVEHHYLDRDPAVDSLDTVLAKTVDNVLVNTEGDVLVFLPGVAEIERVRTRLDQQLAQQPVSVLPLHGALSLADQDRVMQPLPGQRKLILATNIAETSLTIDGVRVVIDSGLARENRFRAASGMSRLETVRISADSATQRCGRAGRQAPGQCYRLWSRNTQAGLVPERIPEILRTDLAALVLELACWGVTDITALQWVDVPTDAHVQQARSLLNQLALVDAEGRVTAIGKSVALLGLSPRLGCMLLKARERGQGWVGCLLAALLEERDIMQGEFNGSMEKRLELLLTGAVGKRGKRIIDVANRYARSLDVKPADVDPHVSGLLLAEAFPDRIAMARDDRLQRYQLVNGRGASMHSNEASQGGRFIVITDIDDRQGDSRIFRYAQLSGSDMEYLESALAVTETQCDWDDKQQRIVARKLTHIGAVELASTRLDAVSDEQAASMFFVLIRKTGIDMLPWSEAARSLQARIRMASTLEPGWPDVNDPALLENLETWLFPFIGGVRSRGDLGKLDMAKMIKSMLDWQQQQWLDQALPERYELPGGRHARVDYVSGTVPLMRSRLQDFFGLNTQPRLANGRVDVIIELLSPANRPVQRTQDLAGFWSGSYAEVRKEMKGRYPKHQWPEQPGQSIADQSRSDQAGGKK